MDTDREHFVAPDSRADDTAEVLLLPVSVAQGTLNSESEGQGNSMYPVQWPVTG